ncbi:unnamed protein product [Acanthoscelides obtectus]|uniref:Uncharacterized protein n=1 Tax=Acanthoscelides obtectus TaxID=200917 RepID=A0A9P0LSG3_ACAOB|nr:unnamed protein product [Acanthoscelides obtectus]CAK1629762.1 hypothetical protein AOBTE_LOCUS5933 [Acanthoscelides obtectus]
MATNRRWKPREVCTKSWSVLVVTWFAAATTVCLAAWQENIRPKMYVQLVHIRIHDAPMSLANQDAYQEI